jgi:hypothetical protein
VSAAGVIVGKIELVNSAPIKARLVAHTCLAVIIDRQAKKSVCLNRYEFGQALGGILKVVDLPASRR